MNISSNWIKEHLGRTILDAEQIIQALERAGIEVEQVISSPEIDRNVVVGLITKVIQHPNADKLRLVDVKTSQRELRIVCGAPNVREGMKVAVAQVGAVLPSGDTIEEVKLRGELSEGMICSQRELGIGSDHTGIMGLPSDTLPGTLLCDLYPSDTIIDIKTQANRFDIQSIIGLAREVAAMTGLTLRPMSLPKLTSADKGPRVLPSPISDRYMLALLNVPHNSSSPWDIIARLQACGMRTISPVVDATNYAMIETGQPLHSFDAAKVTLPIEVRFARSRESLTTLDGVTRNLTVEDLVIADRKGPIALAGVMGGLQTEVTSQTRQILLESAVFDAIAVRKTARRHNLRTEASARYERALPTQLPPLGLARAVDLIQSITGGQLVDLTDVSKPLLNERRITISSSRVSQIIGIDISYEQIAESLAKLQIVASVINTDTKKARIVALPEGELHPLQEITCEIPWWRPDLQITEDIAEEVVRVIGYDKIPSSIPVWRPKRLVFDNQQSYLRKLRDLLYGAGLFEVMTYSFVSADKLMQLGGSLQNHLKLKNPLSSEQAYLRSDLLPSHLAVLEKNRTYAKIMGFYEISKVFVKTSKGKQPDEPLLLGITMNRPENVYRYIKGLLDEIAQALNLKIEVKPAHNQEFAPGRSGDIYLLKDRIGRIGQVYPEHVSSLKVLGDVAFLELDLSLLLKHRTVKKFNAIERYPVIERDLSIVVPIEVLWSAICEAARPFSITFIEDYYGKELGSGYKAVTLRINLTGVDRTPTEAQAVELESKIFDLLARKVSANRR
jgi:phenylalanyl-tRNA synthetase beta chain